jgi:hypothetical protein
VLAEFYDIYGFRLAVEGPATKTISQRYTSFKTSQVIENPDLSVKVCEGEKDLPTKPGGSLVGLRVPFDPTERILWYQKGVASGILLWYLDGLLWWPDRVFMHAGAVAKKGKALMFMGGPNVGKTRITLNLLDNGYDYLSDDWMLVGDGKAYPLSRTIKLNDYNLRNQRFERAVLGRRRFFYKPIFRILRTSENRSSV